MAHSDVIIVGGGMVGSAAALALTSHGFEVALVDQMASTPEFNSGSYDLRVSAVNRKSEAIFEALGVWSAILGMRSARYQTMDVWDQNSKGHICFNAKEIGQPYLGHIIENNVILSALRSRLTQHMDLRLGHAVVNCHFDQHNWHITLADGSELVAPLLVGADGARSMVRKVAGLDVKPKSYGQHALVATVKTENPHQKSAYQRFMRNGPLAFLPLSDPHFSSIVWTSTPNDITSLLDMSEEQFNQALDQAFDYRLGKVQRVGGMRSFPLYQHHATGYVNDGVALIGDAAHTIHPLAGQGVNLGFADAWALANVCISAREQQRRFYSSATLVKYQHQRWGENARMRRLTSIFNNSFSGDDRLKSLMRGLGLNSINACLPIKQQLMSAATGDIEWVS